MSVDITTKPNSWRVVRFILFCILIGLVSGSIEAVPGIDELKSTLRHNGLYLALTCMAMIALEMVLVYFGGVWAASEWLGNWKRQLLSLVAFTWAISTAGMLARLLVFLMPFESKNSGVMVLFAIVYFTLGCLVLLPFQYLAMRGSARRHNIPIWPNLPKA